MEEICKENLNDFKSKGDANFSGFIKSKEKYDSFLFDLTSNGFSFSTRSSETKSLETNSVFFESGIPCTSIQRMYLQCGHGELYYEINKSSINQDHPSGKKKRFHIQNTKKIGCPSKLNVKVRHVYPEYQVDATSQSKRMKLKIAKELKAKISAKCSNLKIETWYFVEGVYEHSHDNYGEKAILHPELISRIEELVEKGVTAIPTVKFHLKEKVNEMFEGKEAPNRLNSAFFPTDAVIYSHVYKTLFSLKGSRSDQEALEGKINTWKANNSTDNFFFRPFKVEESSNTPLLFCHQSCEQKKLLQLYGNNTCLLDATYKTTKYSLPLFFIVVKTNVRFIVVGTFVCLSEDATSISEGLSVFREWNPSWRPRCFITDYCEAEINALESVFPECDTYICSFHREQAWVRWTRKRGNIEHGSSEEVLTLFRSLLHCKKEDLSKTIENIKGSELWEKNPKVQTYFTNFWLKITNKWVPCLIERNFDNNISSNNGVEVQNRIFKKSYLSQSSDKSLTGMLTVLVEQFLPQAITQFHALNLQQSSNVKQYNPELPPFLHNRPHKFIKHIMPRYTSAANEFKSDDCQVVSESIVMVASQNLGGKYIVDFKNVSCTCADFQRWKSLCKHFCACFIHVPQFSFEVLPETFRNNPLNIVLNSNEVEIENEHIEQQIVVKPSKEANRLVVIREQLKSMIDATYNMEDGEHLDIIVEKISSIKEEVDKYQKKEDSLVLLSNTFKKRKREPTATVVDVSCSELPLPCKSKYGKFRNRVGESADLFKEALNFQL